MIASGPAAGAGVRSWIGERDASPAATQRRSEPGLRLNRGAERDVVKTLQCGHGSLVLLLPFAAILAADVEEIGVGVGALYEVDRVVIRDELC